MDPDTTADETASVPNDEFCLALIRLYLTAHGMNDVARVLDSEIPTVRVSRYARFGGRQGHHRASSRQI